MERQFTVPAMVPPFVLRIGVVHDQEFTPSYGAATFNEVDLEVVTERWNSGRLDKAGWSQRCDEQMHKKYASGKGFHP